MATIPDTKYEYNIDQLVNAYKQAVADILDELERIDPNSLSRDIAANQLADISAQLMALNEESEKWAEKNIPAAARNGSAAAILALGSAKTIDEAMRISKFGTLNKEMVKAVIADTQNDLLAVTQNIDRRIRTAVRTASADVMRRNMAAGINGHRTNKREIMEDLKANLGDALKSGIVDAAGRRWRPETYVDMLVRTKMMYAHNEGTRNEALGRGVMYARISGHGAKDGCGRWENKVVKLVSDAPGSYPTLDEAKGSGKIFHPNCKHVIIPMRNPDDILNEPNAETVEEEPATAQFMKMLNGVDVESILQTSGRADTVKALASASEKLLQNAGIPAKVGVKPIEDYGYCRIGYLPDGTFNIPEYVLNSDDKRPLRYRVKTMFHEYYHAKAHGLEYGGLRFSGDVGFSTWVDWEETFTESAAHYMARQAGVKGSIAPSYSEKLIRNLPKLKTLPEFADCNTVEDFGKKAMQYRFDDKSATMIWKKYSDQFSKDEHLPNWESYVQKNYADYAHRNRDRLIDQLMEAMPTAPRSAVEASFDMGWTGYQNVNGPGFSQSLIIVMQEVGVK